MLNLVLVGPMVTVTVESGLAPIGPRHDQKLQATLTCCLNCCDQSRQVCGRVCCLQGLLESGVSRSGCSGGLCSIRCFARQPSLVQDATRSCCAEHSQRQSQHDQTRHDDDDRYQCTATLKMDKVCCCCSDREAAAQGHRPDFVVWPRALLGISYRRVSKCDS